MHRIHRGGGAGNRSLALPVLGFLCRFFSGTFSVFSPQPNHLTLEALTGGLFFGGGGF